MSPEEALKGKQVTWLTSYSEVRDAFKNPGLLQTSYDGAKETIFADVLVTLEGPRHDQRRRTETALFRPQIVATIENAVIPAEAARLIAAVQAAGESDLTDISRLITTGLAARIVGLDDCDSVPRLEALSALMARLHQGAVIDWTTRPREEVLADVREAREQYREQFFDPSLRRRVAMLQGGEAEESPDLIHLLLVHGKDLTLDTEGMLRETIHYMVATGGTTSTVFIHGCHEIWCWIEAHPEDAEKLADPAFMQACMNEATRLWPPSGWQLRQAGEDLTLRSGRKVRQGETLGLNLITANRDPEAYGPDAERFDPHRPATKSVSPVGLSFGDGGHVCLGKRLTMGVPSKEGSSGVLSAMGLALFAAGAAPNPARAPVVQPGTARHQYSSYPILFRKGAPPARPKLARHEAAVDHQRCPADIGGFGRNQE
jgi:cytochrome P450